MAYSPQLFHFLLESLERIVEQSNVARLRPERTATGGPISRVSLISLPSNFAVENETWRNDVAGPYDPNVIAFAWSSVAAQGQCNHVGRHRG